MIDNIVAAASTLKVTTPEGKEHSLVVDSCHSGRNMQAIRALLVEVGCKVDMKGVGLPDRGQGFINQSGVFFDRSESYKIAKSSGQPFNDEYTLPDNKLDSSCITHFEYNLDDLEYHKESE